MSYMSIKKFAEAIGVTEQTLRNWDKSGKLKPAYRSSSGYRYYSDIQLSEYTGTYNSRCIREPLTIGYCRVSTSKQKENLERQKDCVKQYCIARGYQYQIIEDIGSGINYTKKGLQELLTLVMTNNVDRIVIMYKDRLVRFGFELIEFICRFHCVDIEIIEVNEKSEQEELVEDLIQIITVFGARLSGKRAGRAKKIISELKEGDTE